LIFSQIKEDEGQFLLAQQFNFKTEAKLIELGKPSYFKLFYDGKKIITHVIQEHTDEEGSEDYLEIAHWRFRTFAYLARLVFNTVHLMEPRNHTRISSSQESFMNDLLYLCQGTHPQIGPIKELLHSIRFLSLAENRPFDDEDYMQSLTRAQKHLKYQNLPRKVLAQIAVAVRSLPKPFKDEDERDFENWAKVMTRKCATTTEVNPSDGNVKLIGDQYIVTPETQFKTITIDFDKDPNHDPESIPYRVKKLEEMEIEVNRENLSTSKVVIDLNIMGKSKLKKEILKEMFGVQMKPENLVGKFVSNFYQQGEKKVPRMVSIKIHPYKVKKPIEIEPFGVDNPKYYKKDLLISLPKMNKYVAHRGNLFYAVAKGGTLSYLRDKVPQPPITRFDQEDFHQAKWVSELVKFCTDYMEFTEHKCKMFHTDISDETPGTRSRAKLFVKLFKGQATYKIQDGKVHLTTYFCDDVRRHSPLLHLMIRDRGFKFRPLTMDIPEVIFLTSCVQKLLTRAVRYLKNSSQSFYPDETWYALEQLIVGFEKIPVIHSGDTQSCTDNIPREQSLRAAKTMIRWFDLPGRTYDLFDRIIELGLSRRRIYKADEEVSFYRNHGMTEEVREWLKKTKYFLQTDGQHMSNPLSAPIMAFFHWETDNQVTGTQRSGVTKDKGLYNLENTDEEVPHFLFQLWEKRDNLNISYLILNIDDTGYPAPLKPEVIEKYFEQLHAWEHLFEYWYEDYQPFDLLGIGLAHFRGEEKTPNTEFKGGANRCEINGPNILRAIKIRFKYTYKIEFNQEGTRWRLYGKEKKINKNPFFPINYHESFDLYTGRTRFWILCVGKNQVKVLAYRHFKQDRKLMSSGDDHIQACKQFSSIKLYKTILKDRWNQKYSTKSEIISYKGGLFTERSFEIKSIQKMQKIPIVTGDGKRKFYTEKAVYKLIPHIVLKLKMVTKEEEDRDKWFVIIRDLARNIKSQYLCEYVKDRPDILKNLINKGEWLLTNTYWEQINYVYQNGLDPRLPDFLGGLGIPCELGPLNSWAVEFLQLLSYLYHIDEGLCSTLIKRVKAQSCFKVIELPRNHRSITGLLDQFKGNYLVPYNEAYDLVLETFSWRNGILDPPEVKLDVREQISLQKGIIKIWAQSYPNYRAAEPVEPESFRYLSKSNDNLFVGVNRQIRDALRKRKQGRYERNQMISNVKLGLEVSSKETTELEDEEISHLPQFDNGSFSVPFLWGKVRNSVNAHMHNLTPSE